MDITVSRKRERCVRNGRAGEKASGDAGPAAGLMTNITGILDPERAMITEYNSSYREIYIHLKGLNYRCDNNSY
jgi:hypothetical protein